MQGNPVHERLAFILIFFATGDSYHSFSTDDAHCTRNEK